MKIYYLLLIVFAGFIGVRSMIFIAATAVQGDQRKGYGNHGHEPSDAKR